MSVKAEDLTLVQRAALLSGQSEWETREIKKTGLKPIILSDGPNGVRRQTGSGDHLGLGASKPATCFPTSGTVASSWDIAGAEEVGKALGEEAKTLGVQVSLGPGICMKRNPLCGRNFEYYSEDPLLAGRLAGGFVRGLQSNKVSACLKHFAVNSQELRRQASNSIVDERTLRELYLTAFEVAIKESKPWTIMTSYNMVNGVYAHENEHLIKDILRGEWGYQGMVVSDWGGSNDVVESARVGSSLEMPAPGLASTRELVEAVKSGRLKEEDLNARAQEVLDLIDKVQVRNPDGSAIDGYLGQDQIDRHHEVARRIAEKSFVLLTNEIGSDGRPTLPLKQGVRLAVVGDMAATARYQGSGSSKVNATKVDNLLDELKASQDLSVSGYAQGYDRQGAQNQALIDQAVALVKREDVDEVVICMGLDERSESEGLDRSSLKIPQVQVDLLDAVKAIGKPIVVVLVAGSAVETDWLDGTQAALYIGLSGQAGASAAVNLLTGKVNPSGHLAETWPLSYEDVPSAGNFPVSERDSVYREGLFMGYRYYTTADVPVRFPFGYGLSYSTFDYSMLRVDDNGVTFDVKNTSSVPGDTVAQMYVGRDQQASGVLRIARELKGFAKVHLEPGETKQVRIDFDEYTYRHFDAASDSWQAETGAWDLWIGADANTLLLHATHVIQGTMEQGKTPDDLGHYLGGHVKDVTDAEVARLLGHPLQKYDNGGVFQPNDAISSWTSSRSWLARAVVKTLQKKEDKAVAKTGSPDLNMLFVLNMPPRAMAKMTGGMISPDMVDRGILDIPNKHFWKGLGHVISGYFRNQNDNKKTLKEIEQ
ncbi:MAG: glycoside hydrolase family 3 C-terminal domain-containing protein [Parascardovia denticolens]